MERYDTYDPHALRNGVFRLTSRWSRPMKLAEAYAHRHPDTVAVLRHFEFGQLPPHLAEVSEMFARWARTLVEMLPDDPELTCGLRDLLHAKDSCVRVAVQHPPDETTWGAPIATPAGRAYVSAGPPPPASEGPVRPPGAAPASPETPDLAGRTWAPGEPGEPFTRE